MITAYLWTTPNGYKVAIALEEMGLAYDITWVDIGQGEQFSTDFLNISPNGRIPAIYDHETGISLMESGAILQYLSEKSGLLAGSSLHERAAINQWLHWQMGGLGPMVGQANHFRGLSEKVPYAEQRYLDESVRLFKVLDKQLAQKEFIAGDYSIADIACAPWAGMYTYLKDERLEQCQNVINWIARIMARPAVRTALSLSPNRE